MEATAHSTGDRNLRVPGEVAHWLGVPIPSYYRIAKQPGFPAAIELAPRTKVIRESDLVAFMDRKQAEASR